MGNDPSHFSSGAELGDPPTRDPMIRAVARARARSQLFGLREDVLVGRYRLQALAGAGGMGVVWRAHDPELDRGVAIKLVRASLPEARARMLAEGQALARLSHPNVVPVYDVGVVGEQVYLVMEWVPGQTLRAYCDQPRTVREIVAIYRAAGEGLRAVHRAGLIHRDFKPDNALVGDDGRVRILDFGLARGDAFAHGSHPESPAPSASTAGAGTPRYMAPEQAAGEALTPAVDQYAFGVSLREALEGRSGPGVRAVLPRWLDEIVARSTALDRRGRFASMDELLAALARDPGRIWRRRAIAAAVLAAGIGAFAAGRARTPAPAIVVPPAPDECAGGDAAIAAQLAPAWSPAIRAQIGGVLAGRAYRDPTLRFFDRWAATWTDAYRRSCAGPDPAAGALHRTCLRSIRDEVGVVMDQRAALTPEMWATSDLPRIVPMPEGCAANPRGLAPAPPAAAVRTDVARLRIELATTRGALLQRGHAASAVDIAPQLARARATGYAPLIAEAMLLDALDCRMTGSDRPCSSFADAAAQAEAAGHDRMLVEALLLQLGTLDIDRTGEADELRARLTGIVQRAGNPFHIAMVTALDGVEERRAGRFERALAQLALAGEGFARLEIDDWTARTHLMEADVRFARHRGDDLERAAALVRAAIELGLGPVRSDTLRLLHDIEWHRGRAADALPLRRRPLAAGAVTVKLRAVAARGPVAGAQVGAARRLFADAERVAMPEHDAIATAETGAAGTVELAMPPDGAVLVRAGGLVGAAAVPAGGGALEVRLVPAGSIAGIVEGLGAPPRDAGDPRDALERAARRELAVVYLATRVGGRSLRWAAPVDEAGRWSLPAVLPGAYTLAVQARSGLDTQARHLPITVAPGPNQAPPLGFGAPPRTIQLTYGPSSTTDTVIAFAGGGRVPATWPELAARVEAAPAVSFAQLRYLATRDPSVRLGDKQATISLADGPHIACALRAVSLPPDRHATRLVQPPSAPPPVCRAVTGDARIEPEPDGDAGPTAGLRSSRSSATSTGP